MICGGFRKSYIFYTLLFKSLIILTMRIPEQQRERIYEWTYFDLYKKWDKYWVELEYDYEDYETDERIIREIDAEDVIRMMIEENEELETSRASTRLLII